MNPEEREKSQEAPKERTPKKVERKPLYTDEPKTLGELFLKSIHRNPRHDALSFKKDGSWHHMSTDEVTRKASSIAAGLGCLGIRQGDRVAILASNSPDWTLTDAGCQIAGVVDVPIYTTLAKASVKYVLNDSGARVIFIEGRELLDYVREILPECPSIEKIVLFDESAVEGEMISLRELIAKGESELGENPSLAADLASKVGPDDMATLIYTSGTTGEPKGVRLTHTNLMSNAIDASEKYGFSIADTALSVLPLSHVFERSAMYLYLFNGMAVYYAESIEKVADNLKEVKPTIFVGVPRIFEKVYAKAKLGASQASAAKESIFDWAIEIAKTIARHKEDGKSLSLGLALKARLADAVVFSKLRAFFGGNLRFCITGGAALSDTIYLIFTGAGIPIMQGYGLTETSPVTSSNNPIDSRLGSVGKPIRCVEVRIASDGEVEVCGPNVMLGYYNKPEANNEAFTEDGWFKTGDIGELDKDGFLRITDRKKELFKTSGGKYIAPAPIEQMIKGSRFVAQAVLIGNERKFASALIVPSFEQLDSYLKHKGIAPMTPEEMCTSPVINDLLERQVAKLTDGLGNFETVKKIRLLPAELTVESGELTPTLKVRRRIVDEKYKNLIEDMYKE